MVSDTQKEPKGLKKCLQWLRAWDYICNPNPRKAQRGGSQIWGLTRLQSEILSERKQISKETIVSTFTGEEEDKASWLSS